MNFQNETNYLTDKKVKDIVKQILPECIDIIKEIDCTFSPKLKIKYIYDDKKSGSIEKVNGKFILKINLHKKTTMTLIITVLHELVHLWIGPDIETGRTVKPIKCDTRRERLFHYIERINPKNFNYVPEHLTYHETFEDNLVDYTILKLTCEKIDSSYNMKNFPLLNTCFENKTTDYFLLKKIEKYLPDVITAINTLTSE
jgi:hypothetical protein